MNGEVSPVKYTNGNTMKKAILLLLVTAAAFAAQRFSPSITSFTTGQVSPRLEARSDFIKYNSSCRTVENMIVRVEGPVSRRPGTAYIADTNDSTSEARLIPFEYSTDDSYILSLEDGSMGFFRTTE